MSLRGRINQHIADWRTQMAQPRKPAPTPAPDTSDGIDLGVLIVAAWIACFIAGIVVQRFFSN